MKILNFKEGQVMILTVIILGGIILGATTIAGLLMIYQIKQSTNIKHSTMAVYAADTGLEFYLYHSYAASGTLSNGATFELTETFSGPTPIVKSIGQYQNSLRAFELSFGP